jgi:hypothetical protein
MEEKCHSPALLHGGHNTCRAGRKKNIIMWNKDREILKEEGD